MTTRVQLNPWRTIFLLLVSGSLCGGLLAQSTRFNYQGRLSSNGVAADGDYDLTFSLFDAPNSGNPVGGIILTSTVVVVEGAFNTSLDFGDGVFTGPPRWLELSVRTNGSGNFQLLSPRQELLASPYALHATTADRAASADALPPNTIDTTALADGSVTTAKIATGQVVKSLNGLSDAVTLQAGPNITLTPIGNAVQISAADGGGGLALPFSGSVGTADPLFSVNNPGSGMGLQADTASGWAVFGRSQGNSGVFGQTLGSDAAGVLGRNEANTGSGQAIFGYASGNALGVLGVSEGGDGISGRSNAEGKSGVFGYSERNTGHGGTFQNTANGPGITGISEGGTAVEGFSTSGWAMFGRSQNNDGVFGQTLGANASGVLGRNESNTGQGQAVFGYASGNAVGVLGVSEAGDGISGRSNARGKSGVFGYTQWDNGYGGYFVNAGGGEAFHAEGRAFVSGELSVAVLTIRGGADLAEPFESSQGRLAPGAVVAIDDANPGKLKEAASAYDTKVAGVISGAGGVNPGIALRQEGVLEEHGQNVALTGRVYVQADATFGAIRPGDLLTTSATPGHAMRASDSRRAPGAVLGKAMTPLAEGRGLVLVLVSLQ